MRRASYRIRDLKEPRVSTKFYRIALLFVAIGITGWAHSKVSIATRNERGESFVPSPRVASTMAFGFNALLADYHWLQAVQVVGGDAVVDADTARHLGKLIDVVTTLNPHVGHPYRFAAVWLTHDEELVRTGNRLLERAIENHPDDWRNYFYLGFNHFFYLADYPAAAEALEIAMNLPDSPAYLPRLVARLKSQHADIDVAEVFLRELLRTTRDEEAKAKLQVALDEIEIEYKARHLDRARAAYLALSGRDINGVEDLVRDPFRVLEKLPSPEPDSIPRSLSRGSVWQIDPERDRIESSYLGSRYEVHYSGGDRERLKEWGKDGNADVSAGEAGKVDS
jgi:tetratricopeptide (TPR) repeat protein